MCFRSKAEGLRTRRDKGAIPSPSSKAREPRVLMSENGSRWLSQFNRANAPFLCLFVVVGPLIDGRMPPYQ